VRLDDYILSVLGGTLILIAAYTTDYRLGMAVTGVLCILAVLPIWPEGR